MYRLAIGIATALASIHRAGIVRRDLKPANVLLGPDGPRLIDFGIVKTEETSRSATGLKGTPRWMAPELFRGKRATPAVRHRRPPPLPRRPLPGLKRVTALPGEQPVQHFLRAGPGVRLLIERRFDKPPQRLRQNIRRGVLIALLRAWPRLAEWVAAENGGLGTHQSLAGAARVWNTNGRKQADLYQGSALDGALTWASVGRRQLTLNLAERAFLDASVRQTRDRARLRAAVTVTLAVLLVVALGAGGSVAVQSRDLRKTNATVERQRDSAVGRRLAGQAVQLRRTDPPLARRLAVVGRRGDRVAGVQPGRHPALQRER